MFPQPPASRGSLSLSPSIQVRPSWGSGRSGSSYLALLGEALMWPGGPGAPVGGVQGTRAAGDRSARLPGSRALRTGEPVPPGGGGGGARRPRTRSPAGLGPRGARAGGRLRGGRGRRGRKRKPLPLRGPRRSRWLGVYVLPRRFPAFYKYIFARSRRFCAALRVDPDFTSVLSAPLSLSLLPSPSLRG